MSSKTDYLQTDKASVPITTATGDRVQQLGAVNNLGGFSDNSGGSQDSTGVASALGAANVHTIHVDHDAPHTAEEKPTLPRHGG
ncbi:hypothetical protein HDU85_005865 [Gaertneriomyces sp. JEL0708]|nr:hypothetical protein HDU85_005865 [Gaertneriomyces sp. JEL0708]